ncbi:hypothetical protein PVAP13_4KG363076 [Panicum virgatum]|uniref:Uncharacterized protein n=1 Tax=Panicum virgatum TaxID=38727 RepID=A0A8T0TTK1_PANVG|nr:hypothetical protein PVAP13_4KG363076 [Panicum virgatum]
MMPLNAAKLSFAAAAASRARRWSRVIRLTSSRPLSLSLPRRRRWASQARRAAGRSTRRTAERSEGFMFARLDSISRDWLCGTISPSIYRRTAFNSDSVGAPNLELYSEFRTRIRRIRWRGPKRREGTRTAVPVSDTGYGDTSPHTRRYEGPPLGAISAHGHHRSMPR